MNNHVLLQGLRLAFPVEGFLLVLGHFLRQVRDLLLRGLLQVVELLPQLRSLLLRCLRLELRRAHVLVFLVRGLLFLFVLLLFVLLFLLFVFLLLFFLVFLRVTNVTGL